MGLVSDFATEGHLDAMGKVGRLLVGRASQKTSVNGNNLVAIRPQGFRSLAEVNQVKIVGP